MNKIRAYFRHSTDKDRLMNPNHELAILSLIVVLVGVLYWAYLEIITPPKDHKNDNSPRDVDTGQYQSEPEPEPELSNTAWLDQAEKELAPKKKRRNTDRLN